MTPEEIKALQEENRILRECVEKYAKPDNWIRGIVWLIPYNYKKFGFELAQETLDKIK